MAVLIARGNFAYEKGAIKTFSVIVAFVSAFQAQLV